MKLPSLAAASETLKSLEFLGLVGVVNLLQRRVTRQAGQIAILESQARACNKERADEVSRGIYYANAFNRLERDHYRLLTTISAMERGQETPAHTVCINSACATGDRVPHMVDERDHRTYGEVKAEQDRHIAGEHTACRHPQLLGTCPLDEGDTKCPCPPEGKWGK